ncbi:MAG: ribonuclease H-like domain-containing protein [Eubacterium sp.]|nr:ribonuclease H-like domain-containing protein [Eubacterium sp.]
MHIHEEAVQESTAAQIHTYLPDRNAVLFDIETTGLSAARSHLYLIGAIFEKNGIPVLRQWFLDRPSGEKEMLESFFTFLEELLSHSSESTNRPVLVHYNGAQFDIPYLRKKAAFFSLNDPFDQFESIDLYKEIKPCKNFLGLESLKQKSVEKFLRISRDDTFSGGELIPVYQKYLESGDEELLQLLLLHNHDDVCGMARILPIRSYAALFRGDFCEEYGFSGEHLLIHLLPELPLPMIPEKSSPCVRLLSDAVLVPSFFHGEMKYFLDNYKDYYYLPYEDTAVHKSVAAFVDSSRREKAKAANCYQRKSGLFYAQNGALFQPVFRTGYREEPAFFCYEDGIFESDALHTYALELLQTLL